MNLGYTNPIFGDMHYRMNNSVYTNQETPTPQSHVAISSNVPVAQNLQSGVVAHNEILDTYIQIDRIVGSKNISEIGTPIEKWRTKRPQLGPFYKN